MVGSLQIEFAYDQVISTAQNKINRIKEPDCGFTHVPVQQY